MPSFTLNRQDRFTGTVDAYARTTDEFPGVAALGAIVESQTMGASGATFTTLSAGRYWFVDNSTPTIYASGTVGEDGEPATASGVAEVTGATLVVDTGLSEVDGAVVSLNEAPGAGAGDVFTATVTASGSEITISIWQDDATAATEDTTVSWLAFGSK